MIAPSSPADTPAPILEVRDLSRKFGGVWALRDVSFAVAAGEVLGVIGPNGAGKTTLINLITGHLRPSGGHVLVGGIDVTKQRPWVIAHDGVARTFQIVKPFRGVTVRENVAIGAMHGNHRDRSVREALETADQILELVGITHRAGSAPSELSVADARRLEHVMKAIVSISDRIVVLHHGSILTSGTPDQVLSDPRVIEAYLGHRFARRRAT